MIFIQILGLTVHDLDPYGLLSTNGVSRSSEWSEDPLKYADSNSKTNKLDGISVESKFNIRLVDSANQMYEEVWTVNVDDHGRQKRFEVTERNRAIFPQEFLLFISSRTDFEFVGWWRDWDLSKPIDGQANANRPVALVKRK